MTISKISKDEGVDYFMIVIPSQIVSIQLIQSNLFQTEDAVGGKLEDFLTMSPVMKEICAKSELAGHKDYLQYRMSYLI